MKKVFIIIAVIIGILLSFQIRSFKKVELLIERSKPTSILAELRTFQLANEQLRAHLAEEETLLSDINSKITSVAVEDEIQRLRSLSGEQEIYGEGVELTFSKVVPEYWISDLVAQMVGSGAEAISINDLRLTAKTGGFRTVNGGLVMGKSYLRSPFRVAVIGPEKEITQAIAQSGGIIDKMESAFPGLVILVTPKNKVVIPALPKI